MKKDECIKRLRYLKDGKPSLKSELANRKISPESEVLQEALMLKKNAIEADIELATEVSENILGGKVRKTNHSLLTIANTTNQIRRSITALDKDLDLASNSLACIQITAGIKKNNDLKPLGSKIETSEGAKRGAFGLVGDDTFADDSVLMAPSMSVAGNRQNFALLRKARKCVLEKMSRKSFEILKPLINKKRVLEPLPFFENQFDDQRSVKSGKREDIESGSFVEEESCEISGNETSISKVLDQSSITSGASKSFFALATKPIESKESKKTEPVPEKSFSFGFGSETNSPAPESLLFSHSPAPAPSASAKGKDFFSYTLPNPTKAPEKPTSIFSTAQNSFETTKQTSGFSFPTAKDSPANPFGQSSNHNTMSKPFSFAAAVKKEGEISSSLNKEATKPVFSFAAAANKEEPLYLSKPPVSLALKSNEAKSPEKEIPENDSHSEASSPASIKSSEASASPLKSVASDFNESDEELDNTFGNTNVKFDSQDDESSEKSALSDKPEHKSMNDSLSQEKSGISEKASFQIDASFVAGVSVLLADSEGLESPGKNALSEIDDDEIPQENDVMDGDEEGINDGMEANVNAPEQSSMIGGLGGFSTKPKKTINAMFDVPAPATFAATSNGGSFGKPSFSGSFESGAFGGSSSTNNPFASAGKPSFQSGQAQSSVFGPSAASQQSPFGSSTVAFGNSSFGSENVASAPSVFGAAVTSISKPPQPEFGEPASSAFLGTPTSSFSQSGAFNQASSNISGFGSTGFSGQAANSTPAFSSTGFGTESSSAFSGTPTFSPSSNTSQPAAGAFGSTGFGQGQPAR